MSLVGLSGLTERWRQFPTEFCEQRAQGGGNGLGIAARRRAGSGQLSLADLRGLISAGGSSLIVTFMALGIAQNVCMQSKALRF